MLARQNHRLGAESLELRLVHGKGMDLTIDAALAHPPSDELRHLAAEIEDQNLVGGWRGHGRGHLSRIDAGKRHRLEANGAPPIRPPAATPMPRATRRAGRRGRDRAWPRSGR